MRLKVPLCLVCFDAVHPGRTPVRVIGQVTDCGGCDGTADGPAWIYAVDHATHQATVDRLLDAATALVVAVSQAADRLPPEPADRLHTAVDDYLATVNGKALR